MQGQDAMDRPGAGLLGCDREVFAQIWSRVSPGEGCPVEPLPPSAPAPAAPEEVPGQAGDPDAVRLQELLRRCAAGGVAYRAMSRRRGRTVSDLERLRQTKQRHTRRLNAAYFLLTGVRYQPETALPAPPAEDFLPALRTRFREETQLARELEALSASAADPALAQLYRELAGETLALTRTIRDLVEREG